MGQFIEFAEFPLSVERIASSADCRGVFVVLLQRKVSSTLGMNKMGPDKPQSNGRRNTSENKVQ